MRGVLQSLNENAGAIQAIARAALRLITGWYARLTYRLVKVQEAVHRERTAELRSVVLTIRQGLLQLPSDTATAAAKMRDAAIWDDDDLPTLRALVLVQLGRWRPRSSRAGAVALARYTGPRSEACWIQLGGIPLEQVPRGTRHRSISRRGNLGSCDCGARYVELPSSIRVRIMQRADYAAWPGRIARVTPIYPDTISRRPANT